MGNVSWDIKIPNMLLGLRVTPCGTTHKSPSEMLMNRRLRTLLDTIHPNTIQHRRTEQQITNNNQQKHRETDVGEKVMYRNYSQGSPHWSSGTVVEKQGPLKYNIATEDGSVVNRHIDQLIKKKTYQDKLVEGRIVEENDSTMNKSNEFNRNRDKVDREGADISSNDDVVEIPSTSEWSEMLGIPPNAEVGYAGGKLKNKLHVRSNTPYQRPDNNNYIF